MQNSELYVNDTRLDLPADSLIALSYAVNTLTDLKSVQGNISNTINLPATTNNRAALGYPDDMNFNGASIIRQKLDCRYAQNGVDVIPQGNLRITGASKDSISVVVSSGNTDFFDLIKGKITDLDMHEYDHTWNMDNVIASRLHTDGYIYPWINYGNINNNTADIHGQGISPNEMRPAVFAKTIVQKIVASAGYTLINEIENDPVTANIYNRLLLPFSSDKFEHSARYIAQAEANNLLARKTVSQFYIDSTGGGSDELLSFDTIANDPLGTFNDRAHFTAPELMTVDIDFAFDRIVSGSNNGSHLDGAYYELYTNAGGSPHIITRQQTRIEGDGVVTTGFFGRHEKTFTNLHVSTTGLVLQRGEQVWLNIGKLYGCDQTIYPNVTLSIKRSSSLVFGENVQIEAALPDMSCTDFLKFISFLFCAIIQTDNINKTVTIVPFGYIYQNMPLAIDWSDKITNDGEDFDVQIGDYCQQNEAKFNQDDGVSPSTYGNGSFHLTDKNLDLYQDIYDIPFAASLDDLVMGGYRTTTIKKITGYDSIDVNGLSFTISTNPRVVLLNVKDATLNYRWDHTFTTVTTSVPFTCFASGDGSPDLTMPSIFANHYKELVGVLNDQRKLTCYLRLNEIDIQTLNFFRPVYIGKYQSYFYISKITDFTGVKPVKVELIRLP